MPKNAGNGTQKNKTGFNRSQNFIWVVLLIRIMAYRGNHIVSIWETKEEALEYAEEYLMGCGWQQVMPAHRLVQTIILNSCHSYDSEMDMKRYIVVEIDHVDMTVNDALESAKQKIDEAQQAKYDRLKAQMDEMKASNPDLDLE